MLDTDEVTKTDSVPSAVGYVLVSKTMRQHYRNCPNCKSHAHGFCPMPDRPRCHASCVRDPRMLEQHPECQEWEKRQAAWVAAHYTEEHTGGTRLGPLHYFSDCRTLLKRGPRRADARIVPMDMEMVRALDLPICKECISKMLPFESQVQASSTHESRELTSSRG